MRFFDLHCDTIYRILKEGGDIYKNDFHVSFSKLSDIDTYVGCFAICVTEEYGGEDGFKLFNQASEKIDREALVYKNKFKLCKSCEDIKEIEQTRSKGVIFTVEGGMAISDDLSRVKHIYDRGVRVLTLTWNGRCPIGDGSGIKDSGGLTSFGKDAIRNMESLGVIADVSHASDNLFYDVASFSSKPFIATHSNSRAVCGHRRNLTDEQFCIIRDAGGVVGVNLCRSFLSENEDPGLSDVLKHIDQFLSLSGENTLCIGSDFDGTDMPNGITGIESIPTLYEYCLRHNYSESLLDKIFFRNAYDFFIKMI